MSIEPTVTPEVTSIGILSASYSGSTLVSIVLGRAPGVLATSEVFQLLNKAPGAIGCKACGTGCPFWTPEFLDECRRNPRRYDAIASRARERLGITHVIFKEMGWRTYERARRDGNRFDRFVLLMKCPQAYAYSCLVHDGRPVSDSLDRYRRECRGALDFLAGCGVPATVVHFEAFAEAPAIEARRLCDRLGIAFSPAMLELGWTPEMHPLATGNAGAFSHLGTREEFERGVERDPYWRRVYQDRHIDWIRRNLGTVAPDRKWEEGLSDAQKAEVAGHEGAMAVFEAMRDLASR